MKNINEKKLTILSNAEVKALYSIPSFNRLQQQQFFELNKKEQKILYNFESVSSAVYFVLMLGYFKAKPVIQPLLFRHCKKDVAFIVEKYFPEEGKKYPKGSVSKTTHYDISNKVLSVSQSCRLSERNKNQLNAKLKDITTVTLDSRYLFDECLNFLYENNIVLPAYSTLRDLVSKARITERNLHEIIVEKTLPITCQNELLRMLNSDYSLSSLATLKQVPKDFSHKQLNNEIQTQSLIKPLYPYLKKAIDRLNLSIANLEYYSSLIEYYSITKLKRFSTNRRLLFLTCFLYFRYQQANDNLLTAFHYWVKKHKANAVNYGKIHALDTMDALMEDLTQALPLLRLFIDDDVPNEINIGKLRKQVFTNHSRTKIVKLCDNIASAFPSRKYYEWRYYEENHSRVTSLLRKIFLCITFDVTGKKSLLSKQINISKAELLKHDALTSFDLRLLSNSVKPHLIKKDNIDYKQIEYYLYYRVNYELLTGQISANDTLQHRELEQHLISQFDWEKDKHHLIRRSGIQRLMDPISRTLSSLNNTLTSKIEKLKHDLVGNQGSMLRLTNQGESKWTKSIKNEQHIVNNPFFNQLYKTDIVSILQYTQEKTGFLNAFKHVSPSGDKQPVNQTDLMACIIANGTNYGSREISNISDRSFSTLRHTEMSYLRLETTQKCNDILANAIGNLPIYQYYQIENDHVYASIDGQKFETRIRTYKSRYSSKYFREQGVSALTLSCNHVALNTQIIGANEYEGHYAFDLLYNNTSNIDPDVVSTDTHGVNQVNFAILDFFGYRFAPRYARTKHVFNDMFIIDGDHPDIIRIKKPIENGLIESEWDAIQRIMMSLNRKTVTQSTLVKKLNNVKVGNKTLAALKEYNRLVKAIYLLEYVDNEMLRRYIVRVLNKGEAYHQLRRKIASVNGDKFRGINDSQVTLWNDCARIIANAIVYFNSVILSKLLEQFQAQKNTEALKIVSRLSPVAWQNINLNGKYIFEESNIIDLDKLLRGVETKFNDAELGGLDR